MTSRLLVTGATGFLGRQVLSSLRGRDDLQVFAVARSSPSDPTGDWLERDLLIPGVSASVIEETQPTQLLHLAWEVTPDSYLYSRRNLAWMSASAELLDAFIAAGGRRFVGVGTCVEYDMTHGGLCHEDRTPLRPETLYGATKHGFGTAAVEAGRTLDLSVAWVRLFHLYGPHEHPDRLVAYVSRALLEGREAELSGGEQVRDYLSVMEAADALVAVLDSKVEGSVNVGSGAPVPVRHVAELIAQVCAAEHLLRFGSRQVRDGTIHLLAPDVTKLAREVGWRSKLSLEDGLRQTVAWWQERIRP